MYCIGLSTFEQQQNIPVMHFINFNVYSQLSPCGHLGITDTPLIRTAAKSPAKVTEVWLKQTPVITDSRYYGLTDTLFSPDNTILLF